MEIRVGDVVQLKAVKVKKVFPDGDFVCTVDGVDRYVCQSLIDSVFERTETDAEKIARLEARVKELEAQQEPEAPCLPDQLEGYGPWAKTVKVPAGARVREVRTIVHNGEILFCVKLA